MMYDSDTKIYFSPNITFSSMGIPPDPEAVVDLPYVLLKDRQNFIDVKIDNNFILAFDRENIYTSKKFSYPKRIKLHIYNYNQKVNAWLADYQGAFKQRTYHDKPTSPKTYKLKQTVKAACRLVLVKKPQGEPGPFWLGWFRVVDPTLPLRTGRLYKFIYPGKLRDREITVALTSFQCADEDIEETRNHYWMAKKVPKLTTLDCRCKTNRLAAVGYWSYTPNRFKVRNGLELRPPEGVVPEERWHFENVMFHDSIECLGGNATEVAFHSHPTNDVMDLLAFASRGISGE